MVWPCVHLCSCRSVGGSTGASHASHLGDCCPSAYSSGVSYVKKRQVWKSRSETDWPHLEITPDFSTEKNCSTLILTSTCWQEIFLSNMIQLTTVIPQKQKICRFKHRFLLVFENSRGSIVCLRAANPVMRHDWVVLFLCTSLFQFDSQQTYVKTKQPNQQSPKWLACMRGTCGGSYWGFVGGHRGVGGSYWGFVGGHRGVGGSHGFCWWSLFFNCWWQVWATVP